MIGGESSFFGSPLFLTAIGVLQLNVSFSESRLTTKRIPMYSNKIAGKKMGRRERISRLAGPFLVVLLIFALVPARPVFGQVTPPTYTFAECEHVEESVLLGELNRIVVAVFDSEENDLDYQAIVDRKWGELGMDQVVDSAVDKAADKLLAEEGLWDRIKSGWHSPTAKAFATKVIATAFGSKEFEIAVNDLSVEIVDELTVRLQIMTTISASSALLCLEEFIDETFSNTMSDVLEREVQERLNESKTDPEVPAEVGQVLSARAISLAGVGVILGTQIAKALAKKISGRIAGKIVTRIVGKAAGAVIPIAGWIIGGALIIWDIVQLPKGAVPQIRDSLKGDDVKELVRTQIADVVKQEIESEFDHAAENVTAEMYQHWKNLLKEFRPVLRLAEQNPRFREILDGVKADKVEELLALVSASGEVLGTEGRDRTIESGDFERIYALPDGALEILRVTADPTIVLAWAELSAVEIDRIVETKLFSVASPLDFEDAESLGRVLDLEEPSVVEDVMEMDVELRSALLRLPAVQTRWLFLVLRTEDVVWLAEYMGRLDSAEAEELVEYLRDFRGLLAELKSSEELQASLPISLDLAIKIPKLLELVFGTPPDQLGKLSNLIVVSKSTLTSEQLREMIESGQLEQIFGLPSVANEILREKADPALVIEWGNLAGDSLDQVVETELYVFSLPSKVDGPDELRRILNLENPFVIRKLMELDPDRRRSLLDLSPGETRSLILHDILKTELPWLAEFMQELPSLDRRLFVNYLLKEPALVPFLKDSQEASADFPRVIDLALRIQEFRQLLFDTRATDIEKLTTLAVVAEDVLSPDIFTKTIESGQFEKILALPQEAFEILREKADPALVIQWADLAEDSLVRVVENGLFRVAQPGEFQDKGELDAILALRETAAMKAAMDLDQIDRSVILSLTPERASLILTSLGRERLTWLVQYYLAHLSGHEKELLAGHVLDQPMLLQELKHGNVRGALLESDNRESLLIFLAQRVKDPGPWWPTAALLVAAVAVASSDLPLAIFSHYYQTPSLVLLLVLAVVAVLAVVLIRRSQEADTAPDLDRPLNSEQR